MSLYLSPSYFIDADHPDIQAFAHSKCGDEDHPQSQAISLYYVVRDQWRYNPYRLDFRPEALKASTVLHEPEGHCVGKAILLAALLRARNIPSRLHFYQVRNHLGTSRLEEVLGTNVLVFHGATEVYLHESWITITPAFNLALCEKLGVAALEFDGNSEAVFQAFDREKGKFMEYVHDYGSFHDLPYEYMGREFRQYYGDVLLNIHDIDPGPLMVKGLDMC